MPSNWVTSAVSNLADDIRSRGHWQVVIRPSAFAACRVPDISALFPIAENASVQLRGWDFPHIDRGSRHIIAVNWVGQETQWEHMLEIWRIYQTGQFFHLAGFWDDWRDRSGWWPAPPGWVHSQRLGIGDVLFRFAEIFEFAARLSTSAAGDESMHVEVRLCGLANRMLFVDSANRLPYLRGQPRITINEFPFEVDVSRAELVADPRGLALRGSIEVFKRFNWDGPLDTLKAWQAELGRF
jgi:hypothetical protein